MNNLAFLNVLVQLCKKCHLLLLFVYIFIEMSGYEYLVSSICDIGIGLYGVEQR